MWEGTGQLVWGSGKPCVPSGKEPLTDARCHLEGSRLHPWQVRAGQSWAGQAPSPSPPHGLLLPAIGAVTQYCGVFLTSCSQHSQTMALMPSKYRLGPNEPAVGIRGVEAVCDPTESYSECRLLTGGSLSFL